jgi:putative DNA primase/helicase
MDDTSPHRQGALVSLSEILAALERITGRAPQPRGQGYKALCPCHDDHTPSLSISLSRNSRPLLKCHAGCSYQDVLQALELWLEPKAKPHIVATYSYRDRQGLELYEKVRYTPKDFRIRHRGPDGGWVYKRGDAPAVLYRLPEVAQAIAVGETVYLVEGEKDADRLAAAGLASTTNIEGAAKPGQRPKWRREYTEQLTGVARVVLLPDNDEPGEAHMQAIANALHGAVDDIRIIDLPGLPHKGDVSDWLDSGHTVEDLRVLEEAACHFCCDSLGTSSRSSPGTPIGASELNNGAGLQNSCDGDDQAPSSPTPLDQGLRKAEIKIVRGYHPEIVDHAEALLHKHNANLYQRGGMLVRVYMACAETVRGITCPEGAVRMAPLEAAGLKDLMDRTIQFLRYDKREKEWILAECPESIAATLLSRRGFWTARILTGVISAPTLRPDGSILDVPGYDPATGLLFMNSGTDFPPVPQNPTREDAMQALAVLKEPFKDFPFAAPHDRSVALSAVLTGLIRHSLPSAPMPTASAPKMAGGKTLLWDAAAMIAIGRTPTLMSFTDDPEEMRKRVISVLLLGDPIINIDNVETPLHSQTLCTVLTQAEFSDRLLGTNRTVTAPTSCLWLATGNNLLIKGDLITRVLPCYIDPKCERPEERTFDRNLYEWIPANRPRLVQAALTVLRAYHVAGLPPQDIKNFARFEDWSRWVRSALVWLGEVDPCLGRESLTEHDPVSQTLRILLAIWRTQYGDRGTTAKQAVADASATSQGMDGTVRYDHEDLRDALLEVGAVKGGLLDSKRLGYYLRGMLHRVEGGLRFETAELRQNYALFKVAPVGGKDGVRIEPSSPSGKDDINPRGPKDERVVDEGTGEDG